MTPLGEAPAPTASRWRRKSTLKPGWSLAAAATPGSEASQGGGGLRGRFDALLAELFAELLPAHQRRNGRSPAADLDATDVPLGTGGQEGRSPLRAWLATAE